MSRLLIFFPIILAAFYTKPLYLLIDNKYQKKVAGKEIYYAIAKSKKLLNKKKILLGDSVARQFYDCYKNHKKINSLATNQAISLAGQFVLLHNALNAGNRIDTLFLMFNPFSFSNNLDQIYTYHYFIKPFYTRENKLLLCSEVIKQVKSIPFYAFAREPFILTSNWAPNTSKNIFSQNNNFSNQSNFFLSPISNYYLKEMMALSNKYKFKIIVVSTPVSLKFKSEVFQLQEGLKALDKNLQDLFFDYFNDIIYLKSTEFEDDIHLNKPENFIHLYKLKLLG